MRFFQTAGGGLEQPMLPNQPLMDKGSGPKRKNDGENIFTTVKRTRNLDERWQGTGKGSRTEESKGGFIITRGGPPVLRQTTKGSDQRTSEMEVDDENANIAGPSKPRANSIPKHDTSVPRQRKRKLDQDFTDEGAGEQELEEDVRQMNTEAEDLRDRSRASMANMTPAAQRIQLHIPTTKSVTSNTSNFRSRQLRDTADIDHQKVPTTPTRPVKDGMVPVAEQETPQIARNRIFRGEQRAPLDSKKQKINNLGRSTTPIEDTPSRRRSSMSMRGKRSSSAFETTGVITLPHTSVSNTSLYKHIDPDLPESHRIRQLLIWVASRAMDQSLSKNGGRKSVVTQLPPDISLPSLPTGGAEILREIEEDIIRQLAEKRIETNTFSEAMDTTEKFALKVNEQNVKNQAREKLFSQQIEERKKEDLAWAEVAQFYNAYQENILSAIKSSMKAKGKQRASSQEPEDLEPWGNELAEAFRGQKGYEVAKQLSDLGILGVGKGDARRAELQHKEDVLHTSISVSREFVQTATSDLDKRFSLLNVTLAQRTLPPSVTATQSGLHKLANFIPATSIPLERVSGPDPQDLIRAISRTDASRPVGQIGDAARRAVRDVQRVRESQAHQDGTLLVMSERKLTEVPPTPRKPPGTPKRPTTPGARR